MLSSLDGHTALLYQTLNISSIFIMNTGREAHYVCYKTVQTGCWLRFHTITNLNSANAFLNAVPERYVATALHQKMLYV